MMVIREVRLYSGLYIAIILKLQEEIVVMAQKRDYYEVLGVSKSATEDDLKKAYDGLSTYASQDKVDETPVVGLVLIGIVAVLLAGTFVSALMARKKMDIDS